MDSTEGVITASTVYPETIDEEIGAYTTDALIEVASALPAGTVVSAISIGGNSLTPTSLDLEGKTEVWLSELFTEPSRTPFSGHANQTIEVVATVSGNTDAINTNLIVSPAISDDDFVTHTKLSSDTTTLEVPEDTT